MIATRAASTVPNSCAPVIATMSLPRVGFLAFALFLFVLAPGAYGGTVTYDFVDRPADQGIYHVSGSITVNDTAISVGTLMPSDVESYSLSVTHGTTTDFVLSDLADLSLRNVTINASAISLTTPPAADISELIINHLNLFDAPFIGWEFYFNSTGVVDLPEQFYAASLPIPPDFGGFQQLFGAFFDPPNLLSPFDVAVREPTSGVPEPSSLVIAITLFGGLRVGGVWRRGIRWQPVQAGLAFGPDASGAAHDREQSRSISALVKPRGLPRAFGCGVSALGFSAGLLTPP